MIQVSHNTPFYKKLAFILFSIIAGGYLAIIAKEILAPLLFSMMFSIVLLPLAKFFESKFRLPRSIASFLSLIVFVGIISLVFYLVGSQASNLASDWPQFKTQLNSSVDKIQDWVEATYHINARSQLKYFHEASEAVLASGTLILSTTFLSVSSVMLFVVFMLIDIFFLLLYRRLILRFLVAVFPEQKSIVVYEIVEQIQYIIRKYIVGLLLEMFIVSVAVFLSFWIFGIKYAVLLGILTGLLNLIPYLGIFAALVLSSLITFATAATAGKVLIVVVILIVIHLLDSNILLPVVVGSKVKINALITVLGVITGELMWGIPGMFLSIPVIAMAKIIFDRIESLQPWGMLLGEESKDNPITVAKDVNS